MSANCPVDWARVEEICGEDGRQKVEAALARAALDRQEKTPADLTIDELLEWLYAEIKNEGKKVLGATQELGRRGDSSVLEQLKVKLGHPNYQIRQEAFLGICTIILSGPKPSREILEIVIRATKLDDEAPIIAALALLTLNRLGMKYVLLPPEQAALNIYLERRGFPGKPLEDGLGLTIEGAEEILDDYLSQRDRTS